MGQFGIKMRDPVALKMMILFGLCLVAALVSYLASPLKAGLTNVQLPYLRHSPSGMEHRVLAETSSVHVVSIVLALHFVHETTAVMLESLDPTNVAVGGLCSVIHEQAAGSQVQNAAAEVNVTIETNATVNECVLVATNRAYDTGAEILGPDFLSMEVLLEQVVYVTFDDSAPVTDDEVYDLVENGFNRGRGGRVRTRNLLQAFAPYDSLLDVEVLPGLNTPAPSGTPSTLTPSTTPSLGPTGEPTTIEPSSTPTTTAPSLPEPTTSTPTFDPSTQPSKAPSVAPTTVPTTLSTTAPSLRPSSAPSLLPSASPSLESEKSISPRLGEPSAQPSTMPSAQPSSEGAVAAAKSDRITPGVIAAIVGGSAAFIMACCFSFYLCGAARGRAKNGDEEDASTPLHPPGTATSTSGRKRPTSSKGSNSQSPASLAFVPEIVQLDDDHQSLANTTLGEHTAGRKPPKKKRIVDIDSSSGMDSFEEESLYTMGITPRIQPGKVIDDDEASRRSGPYIQPPPELHGLNTEDGNDVFFPDGGDSSDGDSPFKVPPSPMAPKIATLVEEALGAESRNGLLLFEKTGSPEDGDYGPTSDAASKASSSRSRSSVESTIGDTWPTQQLSPSSSSTPKTDNVAGSLIALSPHDREYANDVSDAYVQRNFSIEERDESGMRFLQEEEQQSRVSPIDLQGTEAEEESPSKLLEDEEKKARVSPIDLTDVESTEATATMVTALSTPVRSPSQLLTRKSYPWNQPKPTFVLAPRGESHGPRTRSISPYRTRYLERAAASSPQSARSEPAMICADPATPTGDGVKSPKAFFTPQSNLSSDLESNLRKLDGGKPGPAFPSFGDASVGSSSSSGISNGVDNKWLFGTVTDTLGPRTASADLESLSGRSNRSHRSNRSKRSTRSGKSRGSRGSSGRRPRKRRTGGGSVSSQGSRNSFGSYIEQKSASEISLAPRSLENDLQRLELQLASLKTPGSDHLGSGSVGGSVSGLSRSSLSTHRHVSSKQRVIVVVPPGKLGVILANRHDGKGTVVAELRPHSVLNGALVPGDRLIEIDGENVTGLNVSQITSIMTTKTEQTRRLTVITSTKIRAHAHDSHKNELVSTSTSASGSEENSP